MEYLLTPEDTVLFRQLEHNGWDLPNEPMSLLPAKFHDAPILTCLLQHGNHGKSEHFNLPQTDFDHIINIMICCLEMMYDSELDDYLRGLDVPFDLAKTFNVSLTSNSGEHNSALISVVSVLEIAEKYLTKMMKKSKGKQGAEKICFEFAGKIGDHFRNRKRNRKPVARVSPRKKQQ